MLKLSRLSSLLTCLALCSGLLAPGFALTVLTAPSTGGPDSYKKPLSQASARLVARSGEHHGTKPVWLLVPCGPRIIEEAWIERLLHGCNIRKRLCVDQMSQKDVEEAKSARMVFVIMTDGYHNLPDKVGNEGQVYRFMKQHHLRPKDHVLLHVGSEWELHAEWVPAGSINATDLRKGALGPWNQHLSMNALVNRDPNWQREYEIYSAWGRVFRNFDNGLSSFFPLGWTQKFERIDPESLKPAPQRQHALTFLGNTWAGRGEALKEWELSMESVGLSMNRQKDLYSNATLQSDRRYLGDDPAYTATLQNSAFCLELPGASTECYRLYEILEVGCIPVVRTNHWLPVAEHAPPKLRTPPFVFADPSEAGAKIRTLLLDKIALRSQQLQVEDWWRKVKAYYAEEMQSKCCPRMEH